MLEEVRTVKGNISEPDTDEDMPELSFDRDEEVSRMHQEMSEEVRKEIKHKGEKKIQEY
jgi:hypothetical protein